MPFGPVCPVRTDQGQPGASGWQTSEAPNLQKPVKRTAINEILNGDGHQRLPHGTIATTVKAARAYKLTGEPTYFRQPKKRRYGK